MTLRFQKKRTRSRTAAAALLMVVWVTAPAIAETLTLQTIDGARTALLVRPAAKTPAPLVVVPHGALGTAGQVQADTGWNRIAAREGLLLAYPNGLKKVWNDGRLPADRNYHLAQATAGDLAFLTALVNSLIQSGAAAPSRVDITGLSNGGHMTTRMLCDASQLFAAGAVVIANLSIYQSLDCKGRPRPVLVMNGTDGRLAKWGGETNARNAQSGILSGPRTLAFFAQRNGCSGAIAERRPLNRTISISSSARCSATRTATLMRRKRSGASSRTSGSDRGWLN